MSRRRRRSDEEWDELAAAYRSMRRRRRTRRLRRDTERGVFGGVCAGIARYFGIEPWIVRLGFIALLFLGLGPLPIIAYIVLWVVLDVRPTRDEEDWEDEVDEERAAGSPYVTIRSSPKLGLRVVSADLRELDLRLRRLETYVTSPKYDLDKGFSDMGRR